MRILHVVESLKPEAGSVAISLEGLCRALHQRDVESAAASGTGEAVQSADLVHIHGWGSRLARASAALALRAGKPYVISPMGALSGGPYRRKSWKEKLRSRLSDRRLIRRAAAVTAINEQERRVLQELKIAGNVTVLPCGLSMGEYEADRDMEANLPAPLDGRCLLLLGPIHPVEGWVPLLTAFAELGTDSDGWYIVLAGPVVGMAATIRSASCLPITISPVP